MGILEGGAVALVFFIIGWRTRGRKTGLKDPKPVCGCSHSKGFHENGTGACHHETVFDRVRCRCQQYTGPEPMPELYAS